MKYMLYKNFGFSIKSDIELPFSIDDNINTTVGINITQMFKKPELSDSAQKYFVDISDSERLICKVIDQKNSLIMDFENSVCFQYVCQNSQYNFYYYCYDEYPKEVQEKLISRFGMAYLFSWLGMTVLHGSAVCNNEQAICFIADSNGGKSSVAGLFVANGWMMMADELLVLMPDKKGVTLLPSSPYLHLSDYALKKIPFSHHRHISIVAQFKKDFMEVSEITNRVDLRSFSSYKAKRCQKIVILDRGHDGEVEIHKYKKANAYMTLLHYLYTPIVFPFMRKNLLALMESITLERTCFNDCFIQFEDIKKYMKQFGDMSRGD